MKKLFITTALILSAFTASPAPIYAQQNDQDLFLIAQKAFDDGFYDVAMRYLNQLLEQYPQTEKRVPAKLLLGQCYFFSTQYLKAYDIFQSLIGYSEYKDATLFWLGETYLKGTDYKQAEKQYLQLIDLYPNSAYTPQAYYSLGWLHFEQSNYKKAKETFARMIQKFPLEQLAEDASFKLAESEFNLQNYESAIALFSNYVKKYTQSNRHPQAYFYIAEAYYYQGKYPEAVAYYAKSSEISYDSKLTLMAQVSMGWSYIKLEKFDLAEQSFQEALKISQEKKILSDDVYLGLATLYQGKDERKKALEAFNELITNFPNSPRLGEALLGKANVLYLLNNYPEAIKTYQTILDKFAADKMYKEIVDKAYFGLAWANLKNGNIDEAIKTFRSISTQSDSQTVKVSALTQIGDAYQDVGQLVKSIEVYDQILDEYPDSPMTDYVQFRQGTALLKSNKFDAAILSFQSLQTNFPKSKYLNDSVYYLAVSFFKKNEWRRALENIQTFIKNSKNPLGLSAEAFYIEAICSFNLEQYDQAIKLFEKLIKNFPEQSAIIKNAEFSIAQAYYKLNNVKEAISRFELIVSRYPESDIAQDALIWIGNHYVQSSEYNNAIQTYLTFNEKFPNSSQIDTIRFQLAQIYQIKEQYDEAIKWLKIIGSSDNKDFRSKARLAIAEILSKEMDPKSAIETYQTIIQESPEFKRDALVKIAELYKNLKEIESSLAAYTEALKTDTGISKITNAEIQFNIADNLELLNQADKASEEYLKIPYLYSSETSWVVRAYLRVARLLEKDEKWDQAKKIYNKIIEYKTEEAVFAQERIDWIKENIAF